MACRWSALSGMCRLVGLVPFGCLGLTLAAIAVLPASPASAETLAERIAATPAGETVALPAGTTTGRMDIDGVLTLTGSEGAVLSAPADDAILVVLPGAELRLTGAELLQDGQSKFAVYVDGGAVWLEDCLITGAYEVAVYVASGSLTMQDCRIDGGLYGIQAAPGATVTLAGLQMQGQGDTAIRADGAGLALADVTITDGGLNGVVVINSPEVTLDGLSLSGVLATGVWLQNATMARLSRLSVEISGQALTLSGGGEVALDGFVLNGTTGALTAEGITGSLTLSRGRLQSGDGATTAYLRDIRGLGLTDIGIVGGETGLYLTGALPGARVLQLTLQSQTGTGLFLDGIAAEGDPPVFSGLRGIAAGSGLVAYFRDSGPVGFQASGLLAAGPQPFATEGLSLPDFQGSAIFSAPDFAEAHLPLFTTPDLPPRLIPTGPLWWAKDPALGPGNRTGTLADLAASLPAGIGLAEAVAEFATTGTQDPGALALALTFALPLANAAADPTERVDMELAPPEPGWLWDPQGIVITLTDRSGQTLTATPGDFPLHLARGTYGLALDGYPAGEVSVEPGAMLTLPLPDAPFYVWRDEAGMLRRGPALYLRPNAELAALIRGFRPLRAGEFWGYAQTYAPRRGADRTLAAGIVTQARSDIPALLDELATLRASENWPEFNRRWQLVEMTLDILAQFGGREDAAWLLALPIPPEVQIDQIETAVLIESRLDALADGAALPAARALLAGFAAADEPGRQTTLRLVRALARTGLPEAQPLLADLAAQLQPEDPTAAPDSFAMIELSRLDPALAGALPSAYLDQLTRHVLAHLAGERPADENAPYWIDLWNGAVAALVQESLRAPSGAALRRLPIPVGAGIGPSAWAFADPERLLAGPLGRIGPPDTAWVNGWTYRFPEYLCAALAYRSPADRLALHDRLRWAVIDAVTPAVTPDESESDPALMTEQAGMVGLALDIGMGECVLTSAVLDPFGRDAAGEEAAIFDQLDYDPLWWLRRPRSEKAIADFAAGVDFPTLGGHSALSLAEVEAALASGTAGDPRLQELFLARHALLSNAYQSAFDLLTFGAERRLFRLRSDGGNGSITIGGYLDIRPVLADGKLIVAIRHRIESPDYGGLAAMITEPDRAPYEADQRRLMFETLVLDRAGTETEMLYEGTSAQGVHFFSAPLPDGLADTALHLTMRFVDTVWEIDLPLWQSTLAHDLRAAGTGATGGAN